MIHEHVHPITGIAHNEKGKIVGVESNQAQWNGCLWLANEIQSITVIIQAVDGPIDQMMFKIKDQWLSVWPRHGTRFSACDGMIMIVKCQNMYI